ncbi:hypothetical protein, partial [Gelidibacter salicanalis]|uniref:hypothetical protein n=1 Tax=Gelidibacter salicanalis TaxID=291193 RepID=UPI001B87FA25
HSNQNYARAYKHQFKIGLAKSTIQDTKRYLKVIIFFGRREELYTTDLKSHVYSATFVLLKTGNSHAVKQK